jgi:hypothetical protein
VRTAHALSRLVSLAWRKPAPSEGERPTEPDEWDREISRVGWLELFSVARGPLGYLLERRSAKGVMQ